MKEEELLARLREAFQAEARERLDSLASCLQAAEECGSGTVPPGPLEAAYREAHSLKGAARAVGLTEIEAICQALESLLSALKKGEAVFSAETLDGFYRALTAIEKRLDGTANAEPVSVIRRFLEGLPDRGKRSAKDEAPGPSAAVTERPLVAPRKDGDRLPATGEATPRSPVKGDAREEPGAWRESPPECQGDSPPAELRLPGEEAPVRDLRHTQTVRVDVQKLDALLRHAEELISAKLAWAQQIQRLKRVRHDFEAILGRNPLDSWEVQTLRDRQGAPVSFERCGSPGRGRDPLDCLKDNHRRLLSVSASLQEVVRRTEESGRELDNLIDELMEGAKDVLLQPFSVVFRGFTRMVRDLSCQLEKEVALAIEGGDVEIDRRILEEIKDPLVHLLRNAVDHGIETPAVRRDRGKEPRGTVSIRVVREEARKIRLTVQDDGGGIPLERLRSEAQRRGLLSGDEAAVLDETSLVDLIFQADLSTSPLVTDLSGRGLGMAIVKERVEAVGGRVRAESETGRGTRVTIELPVSLATFRGILVEEGSRFFMVPTHHVESVVRRHRSDSRVVDGRATLIHADRVVPLERLGKVLGLDGRNGADPRRVHVFSALVLRAGDRRVALEVDQIVGEQEMLVKGLGPQLRKVPNVWGATVLGTGQVVPVLNPLDLVRSVSRPSGRACGFQDGDDFEAQAAGRKHSILVAEDSITSRTLLRNILEAAGYSVQTAVDGQEAYTFLRQREFDLVVSDVEMPRMNGFDLTREIRRHEKLKDLPVVLVTSLDSREDRERGMDAGADAYIVKSAFDHTALLDVIDGFL